MQVVGITYMWSYCSTHIFTVCGFYQPIAGLTTSGSFEMPEVASVRHGYRAFVWKYGVMIGRGVVSPLYIVAPYGLQTSHKGSVPLRGSNTIATGWSVPSVGASMKGCESLDSNHTQVTRG
jgi:hypothetical protein